MMNHARVFKKTAPNGKITVYVEKRELIISDSGVEPLHGVLYVDANYLKERKVYGQFVLTFRYGREDEEVMGLRFCNEACLQAGQLWPKVDGLTPFGILTPLQDTLVKRLGIGAVAFTFSVSALAPPSVTLLPARTYMGAPIGTNYDIRIFIGENPEDKPHKRSSIRMGIKLAQVSSFAPSLQPYAAFSKQLLLADGQVSVEATLNKEIYQREEQISVSVCATNHSSRSVKRIKVLVVQFVDVAMFSNGKFKNVVASIDTTEGCPVTPGHCLTKAFSLSPIRGTIKNWIALEEFYDKESALASSVLKPPNGERNVFAIYVSYYVKVKLITSALGGEVCVKVPFKIMSIKPPSESLESSRTAPMAPCERRLPRCQGSPITSSKSMFDLNSLSNYVGDQNGLSNHISDKVKTKNTCTGRFPVTRSTSDDILRRRYKSQPSVSTNLCLKVDKLCKKIINVDIEATSKTEDSLITDESDLRSDEALRNNTDRTVDLNSFEKVNNSEVRNGDSKYFSGHNNTEVMSSEGENSSLQRLETAAIEKISDKFI